MWILKLLEYFCIQLDVFNYFKNAKWKLFKPGLRSRLPKSYGASKGTFIGNHIEDLKKF